MSITKYNGLQYDNIKCISF